MTKRKDPTDSRRTTPQSDVTLDENDLDTVAGGVGMDSKTEWLGADRLEADEASIGVDSATSSTATSSRLEK